MREQIETNKYIDHLIYKWDWMIYRLSFGTMRRMCKRDPAPVFILEKWMQEWRKQNPMSESVEKAANTFFEACRDENDDGLF